MKIVATNPRNRSILSHTKTFGEEVRVVGSLAVWLFPLFTCRPKPQGSAVWAGPSPVCRSVRLRRSLTWQMVASVILLALHYCHHGPVLYLYWHPGFAVSLHVHPNRPSLPFQKIIASIPFSFWRSGLYLETSSPSRSLERWVICPRLSRGQIRLLSQAVSEIRPASPRPSLDSSILPRRIRQRKAT